MFNDVQRSRRRFLAQAAGATAGLAAGGTMLGGANQAQAGVAHANSVSITYLDYQKLRVQWANRWIPKFQAATVAAGHPITVNHQVGPTPDVDFKTKITVEYAANNGPDVSAYGQNNLAPFVSAGYLLDLTPYVSKWPDWSTKYYSAITKQCMVGGKVYAVPQEGGLEMLFYRKDILDKYHISTAQPKNWADLYRPRRLCLQPAGDRGKGWR